MKYVVAGVLVLLVGTWAAWCWLPATFTITNESGQPIRYLRVEVAEKTFEFHNIPPGGTVRGSFHFSNEATLGVTGRFADGTTFGEPCGYVVWESFAPNVDVLVYGDWVGERQHAHLRTGGSGGR